MFVRVLPTPTVSASTSFTVYLIGDAPPSTVGTRSVYSTSTVSIPLTVADPARAWPDPRTVFVPLRLERASAVRPVFNLTGCRLLSVELVGKQLPWRIV